MKKGRKIIVTIATSADGYIARASTASSTTAQPHRRGKINIGQLCFQTGKQGKKRLTC